MSGTEWYESFIINILDVCVHPVHEGMYVVHGGLYGGLYVVHEGMYVVHGGK